MSKMTVFISTRTPAAPATFCEGYCPRVGVETEETQDDAPSFGATLFEPVGT